MGKPLAPEIHAPCLVLCYPEQCLQIALVEQGHVHGAWQWNVPGQAMGVLAPAVENLLTGFALTARDLAGVACVRGPGSFTGLRMTLAFTLGLSCGVGSVGPAMAGLDYLPLLAAGVQESLSCLQKEQTGSIAVLTSARAGHVYMQIVNAGTLEPALPAQFLALEKAVDILKKTEKTEKTAGPVYLLGTGVRKNTASFPFTRHPQWILLPECFDSPTPALFARAVQEADFTSTPPEPLYLRASDAQDNLAAIASGRGIDPQVAQTRLDRATHSLHRID